MECNNIPEPCNKKHNKNLVKKPSKYLTNSYFCVVLFCCLKEEYRLKKYSYIYKMYYPHSRS